MPINVMPPVTAAAPVAPATPAASGADARAAADPSAPEAAAAASGAQPAQGNGARATRSAGAAGKPSAAGAAPGSAADAEAADPGLFARMLGAQIGNLAAAPTTTAQPGAQPAAEGTDSGSDKPAKGTPLSAQAPAVDPSTLLNPALLALQQQPAQAALQQAAQPAVQTPPAQNARPDAAAAIGAAGTVDAAALSATPQPAATGPSPAALRAAAAEPLAVDGTATGATHADTPQQKLPLEPAGQPTFLPQVATGTAAGAAGAAADSKAAAAPTFHVEQQLGTPGWNKAVGEHVMAMVSLKAETAHIQVSPPQLGPIEVTLKMDAHNNAQVAFTADSPATRAALENSLPRLHEMMAAGGIQLGDAQVSGGQSQRQQQTFRSARNGQQAQPAEGEEPDTLATIKASRGVLSIFA